MNVIKLDATLSTNTFLLDLSKKQPLPDKTIVVSKLQLKGRGQLNSHWESDSGNSLTFSVYKQFNATNVAKQPYLLFAVALGVREALANLMAIKCDVKWANDILAENKKICGILTENQVKGNQLIASVIGVGINVNQTSFPSLLNAGSMLMVTGKQFNLDEVLNKVCEAIFYYLQLFENKQWEILKETYEKHLFRKEKVSAFSVVKQPVFNAIIKGVNNFGQLLLELDTEEIKSFNTKEITMHY